MSGNFSELFNALKKGNMKKAKALSHEAKTRAKEQTLEERREMNAAIAKRIDKPSPRIFKKALVLFLDECSCACCGSLQVQNRFPEPMLELMQWTEFNMARVFRKVIPLENLEGLPRRTYVRKLIIPFCSQCFTVVEMPDRLCGTEHITMEDEKFPDGFAGDFVQGKTRRELKEILETYVQITKESP